MPSIRDWMGPGLYDLLVLVLPLLIVMTPALLRALASLSVRWTISDLRRLERAKLRAEELRHDAPATVAEAFNTTLSLAFVVACTVAAVLALGIRPNPMLEEIVPAAVFLILRAVPSVLLVILAIVLMRAVGSMMGAMMILGNRKRVLENIRRSIERSRLSHDQKSEWLIKFRDDA